MGGGMDAVDVAELWALYKRNDWKGFEEVQDAKVFVHKGYYLVKIVGLAEKPVGLYKHHYVHVLIVSRN